MNDSYKDPNRPLSGATPAAGGSPVQSPAGGSPVQSPAGGSPVQSPAGGSPVQSSAGGSRSDADEAAAKAREIKDQAREQAHKTREQARQKAGETAEQLRQGAAELTDQAKAKAGVYAESQKAFAADQVEGVASALHQAASQLEKQHQDVLAHWTDQAASSLEAMGTSLRNRDVETLLRQFQDFARRQPGVFLGGAVVLGFLGARFFKSSSLRSEWDYRSHASGRPEGLSPVSHPTTTTGTTTGPTSTGPTPAGTPTYPPRP